MANCAQSAQCCTAHTRAALVMRSPCAFMAGSWCAGRLAVFQGKPLSEPLITVKARCCSARMSAVPRSAYMPMTGFRYVGRLAGGVQAGLHHEYGMKQHGAALTRTVWRADDPFAVPCGGFVGVRADSRGVGQALSRLNFCSCCKYNGDKAGALQHRAEQGR